MPDPVLLVAVYEVSKNLFGVRSSLRLVIGGGISKAGDKLFVPLRRELRNQITSWSRARIDVVPAALKDDSVLWGALVLAKTGVDK